MTSLLGRRALVTGAAMGIGAAVAHELRARGAEVVSADVAVGDGIVDCDVADQDACRSLFEEHGPFDVLVNNAGIGHDPTPFEALPLHDIDRRIAVNLRSQLHLCQLAVPTMRAASFGRIVNISSRTWMGSAGQTDYAATKAGGIGLTRSLAQELAGTGITVNAVAPGSIATPALEALTEAARVRVMARHPAGRFGTPRDVAVAVAFLAHPGSSAVTGQVLYVDGGRHLYGGPVGNLPWFEHDDS